MRIDYKNFLEVLLLPILIPMDKIHEKINRPYEDIRTEGEKIIAKADALYEHSAQKPDKEAGYAPYSKPNETYRNNIFGQIAMLDRSVLKAIGPNNKEHIKYIPSHKRKNYNEIYENIALKLAKEYAQSRKDTKLLATLEKYDKYEKEYIELVYQIEESALTMVELENGLNDEQNDIIRKYSFMCKYVNYSIDDISEEITSREEDYNKNNNRLSDSKLKLLRTEINYLKELQELKYSGKLINERKLIIAQAKELREVEKQAKDMSKFYKNRYIKLLREKQKFLNKHEKKKTYEELSRAKCVILKFAEAIKGQRNDYEINYMGHRIDGNKLYYIYEELDKDLYENSQKSRTY